MIILDTINKSIQVVLGSAKTTNDMPVTVSYGERPQTTNILVGGNTVTSTNGTTAVTICAAPSASSLIREVEYISVQNADTVSSTVTIKILDTATSYTLMKATILSGDHIVYTHEEGWAIYDNSGALRTAFSSVGSFTSITDSGNLTFTGTGNRITGDFSNATIPSRIMFQTSTANSETSIGIIPSGTSLVSEMRVYGNDSALTNYTVTRYRNTGSESQIIADKAGTGAYLPISLYTSGAKQAQLDTSGNLLVTGSGGLGYGTGAGGTVTQLTSKSTNVTLNKPSGQITMNNAALGAGALVSFQCANSAVLTTDIIEANIVWDAVANPTNYSVRASAYSIANGIILFVVKNETGGSLSDALSINFQTHRGAIS